MRWEEVERNWCEYQESIRRRWQRLTAADLQLIQGRRDELAGLILARYRLAHSEIERQLDEFQDGAANLS